MAEEKPRIQKVLGELYQAEGTMKPKEIGEKIGESPLNVGKDLHSLKERILAETEGEGQWKITDEGREWLESDGGKETGKKDERKEITETVPSQADLFKAEGQRIGFGTRKGDIKLEAVVNYVERIADLDDLGSVWNALTEMGVASDVKKRWIKLYSQNLPNKEIPEELKAKLEMGTEAEKVTTEGTVATKPKRFSIVNGQIIGDPEGDYSFKEALQVVAQEKGVSPEPKRFSVVNGEIIGDPEGDYSFKEALQVVAQEKGVSPEPKRFSVVNGQIIGDPEGDFSFKEALQNVAQEKGASPAQASEMATTLAKMNTDTINLLIPLLTKGSGDDSIIKLILTQMSDLQKQIRDASSQGQGSSEVQALSQQLSELRDTLHNEQLARIQEQNQATTKELIGYIKSLDNKIEAATKGKEVESRIGLMSKALDKGAEQLSGIRQDIKPLAQSFIDRGAAPGEKTVAEKTGFGTGLDRGIERAKEATELEDMLFFGKGS